MKGGSLQEVPYIVILLGNVWYFGKVVTHERWLQLEVRLCSQCKEVFHINPVKVINSFLFLAWL